MNQLRRVVSTILDSRRSARSLQTEVVQLATILADSQTSWSAAQDQISSGETRTPNGLALSPTMAATCADDFVRTVQFIRGAHAAIADVRKRFPDRPARVLYVGCGPYATLGIPLMATWSPGEATFTLLDIHPESVESAKGIVNTLGISESVTSYKTLDACEYHVPSDQPPDVILVEVMQACLKAEPQVAITRHLWKQAPHAILVPEEIRIELVMADPAHEFGMSPDEPNRADIERDRIPVGPVFRVDRASVSSWDGKYDHNLPGAIVRIPDSVQPHHHPMLFTEIRTFKNHCLTEYDSGLTLPMISSIEGQVQPGAMIRFRYDLGRLPQLIGEACDLSPEDEATSKI